MLINEMIDENISRLKTSAEVIKSLELISQNSLYLIKYKCDNKEIDYTTPICTKCWLCRMFMYYTRLWKCLEEFEYDPTFTRARYLWLYFQQLNLPPAKEVMEVFVGQLQSDTEGWEWTEPVDRPRYYTTGNELHEVFDRRLNALKEKLKKDGFKGTMQDCYDKIALLLSEMGRFPAESGDSIRKKIERSRKQINDHESKSAILGSHLDALIFGYLNDSFPQKFLDRT